MSDERITSITTSNYSITPELSYFGNKIRVKFNGSCLKQDKITYTHGTIVNIYIVSEITKNFNRSSYPKLENCFFGAVSLTKNVDSDNYKYSGCVIGFDRKGKFSVGNGFGRKCIIFGVDMSFSAHTHKKKKNILIIGEVLTQGSDGTTLNADKKHSINITENNKKFCLRLHYNGTNSYLFVTGTEIMKFKVNDSEIVATPLCLGNISKDISADNMKKAVLNGYVYDFRVDYDAVAVDDTLDIHKYLMNKNNII